MKAKVILNAVLLLILYTALNFGVRKFIKWVVDSEKPNYKKSKRSRRKNQKPTKKHSYAQQSDRLERKKKESFIDLTFDYIIMLILCLGIIVYALIYIP
jgi:hypothetical protein